MKCAYFLNQSVLAPIEPTDHEELKDCTLQMIIGFHFQSVAEKAIEHCYSIPPFSKVTIGWLKKIWPDQTLCASLKNPLIGEFYMELGIVDLDDSILWNHDRTSHNSRASSSVGRLSFMKLGSVDWRIAQSTAVTMYSHCFGWYIICIIYYRLLLLLLLLEHFIHLFTFYQLYIARTNHIDLKYS